ncbi:hypothetical protein IWQ60_009697, partial [Tieghemiomyces parasiticus]
MATKNEPYEFKIGSMSIPEMISFDQDTQDLTFNVPDHILYTINAAKLAAMNRDSTASRHLQPPPPIPPKPTSRTPVATVAFSRSLSHLPPRSRSFSPDRSGHPVPQPKKSFHTTYSIEKYPTSAVSQDELGGRVLSIDRNGDGAGSTGGMSGGMFMSSRGKPADIDTDDFMARMSEGGFSQFTDTQIRSHPSLADVRLSEKRSSEFSTDHDGTEEGASNSVSMFACCFGSR